MATREKIREGVWQILRRNGLHILEADRALGEIQEFENSQGVVIKVERETEEELRTRHASEYAEGSTNMAYNTWKIAQDMFPKELVAVESLIKETTNEQH